MSTEDSIASRQSAPVRSSARFGSGPWAAPVLAGALACLLVAVSAFNPPQARMILMLAAISGAVALSLCVRAARRAEARRQRSEAAARAEEAAHGRGFQAALEALPDPVLVITATERDDIIGRKVAFANQAARDFLRIPCQGALLITAVRNPEVLEAVDQALFEGAERAAAYETGGAQDRFWRAWTRPLSPGDKGERTALLFVRDETDSRRMEQMRADFLANASHELRTPLASLSGFIETLRGHAKDDPVARERFLAIMAAQADRMSRLIADLLSLSRIELNEHIPPAGSVDLTYVIMDVVDALTPIARAKSVRLDVTAPARGVARVAGDRDQILQVAQNLVDNAIKYAPPGSTVEIELTSDLGIDQANAARASGSAKLSLLTPDRADAARYALLRVRDHGPGIARQFLPRLTERFYRVEGQKSGEKTGTGLGLAIVKHVVNRHRGGMLVESLPGEGAAFVVYLPLDTQSPTAAAPPAENAAPASPRAA
jgi:two-component system phosphate regulon sensor histidine kinase PhoR